jgi:hypothetical protein
MANYNRAKGDPSGKKLARQKASWLAEAGLVGRCLEVLLKRANSEQSACAELLTKIANQERTWRSRAQGRIEPRKKYKGLSNHPLLEKRLTNILYVDESGQSPPEKKLDPPVPTFFALAAISLREELRPDYCKRADAVKAEFFGRTDLTFHEPFMRKREDPFYFEGKEDRQKEFDAAVDKLVEDTDFTVFGVAIRKHAFQKEFVDANLDPYLPTDVYALSILLLLERYIDFLYTEDVQRLGRVIFESQGPLEDAVHQMEYARVLIDGSQWVHPSAFRNWLEPGLRFQPKSGSSAAEIADMFARDLFEWVRDDCLIEPRRFGLFSKRVYCREDGAMGKFGIKVFPDSDIRDNVLKHREKCGAALKN